MPKNSIRYGNSNVKFRVLENKRKKHLLYLKKKTSDDKKVNKNVQAINLISNELSSSLREMTFDNLEYFGENEDFELIDENDESIEKNVNEISLHYEQNEEYADLFDDEGLEENEQDLGNEFKNTNYEFIYVNSRLTLSEFSLFYRWLCQKMKLNKINRNLLLSFIKTILPKDNIVPTSYYKLLKKLNKKTKVSKKCFKICSNCYGLFKNGCQNECQNQKLKKSIDALVFDFKYHLTYIIQKYWNEIQQYKGKFN
jgi:hypothetical protein